VGDALGASIEFLNLDQIRSKFGKRGITSFRPWGDFPAGSYTDDTQMSLATAQGIIGAFRTKSLEVDCHRRVINRVYQEYLLWYESQDNFHERRAPGSTCMEALRSGRMGTVDTPINDSKGCGGVMRTAPIGLVFPSKDAFEIGMDCAAITHGHPFGYLAAGFLAELISWLIEGKSVMESVERTTISLRIFRGHEETLAKINMAITLAGGTMRAVDAIPSIGRGWTGEEALAIAIFCALRFEDDFRRGVLAAVNHDGDSDSTGSIAGAILGARLGHDAIPKNWAGNVENAGKILDIANELFRLREKLKKGASA
jgi:ADP-ribosylglycohydrolase